MLDNSDYKSISIDNYKREILPKCMLAIRVYVTFLLDLVYLKVIANIKHYLLNWKTQFLQRK